MLTKEEKIKEIWEQMKQKGRIPNRKIPQITSIYIDQGNLQYRCSNWVVDDNKPVSKVEFQQYTFRYEEGYINNSDIAMCYEPSYRIVCDDIVVEIGPRENNGKSY